MTENPKVFISYAHSNDAFSDTVLKFANKLREEGIDANIDQYETSPPEGWHRWMENQIMNADFVLVIFTKEYYNKAHQLEGYSGRGVSWEVSITYQKIYDNFSNNAKFIPLILDDSDIEYILTPLKSATIYNINSDNQYDDLYWRLRGINKKEKPPLGKLRPLETKERRTMYFSTCINLDKWNNAKWKGMMFLLKHNAIPVLGFVFDNYKYGLDIFTDWKKYYPQNNLSEEIEITFVEPPFPKQAKINLFENDGVGYFVHVGSNVDGVFKRMNISPSDEDIDKAFFSSISRFHWMPEYNGSINRKEFEKDFAKYKKCFIAPIGIRDVHKAITMDNLMFDEDSTLEFSNIIFATGNNLTSSDNAVAVLGNDYTNKLFAESKEKQ